MQYRACLPLISEVSADASSGVTYEANSGKAIGKLMSVGVAQSRETVTVYGDNGIAEQISAFKSAEITLGATFLPLNCESVMFGATYTAAASGTQESVVDAESDNGDYTGFGFVYCDRENGVDKFRLYWLYKVKWTQPDDDYETKGETISFKNPSIKGTAVPGADGKWRKRETYTTEAAAIEALKTLANYPTTSNG